ncbi:toxin ParE1/3/4 [Pseudomonas benzenivorans]|nr:toxin ParE1/3/4 [Pseudomonas benzenivorans]
MATLDAIANQSDRIGSDEREEIGPGLRSFHLIHCRNSSPAGRAQRPRHVVLYRLGADAVVEVVRLLHDAMEVQRRCLLDSSQMAQKEMAWKSEGNGSQG